MTMAFSGNLNFPVFGIHKAIPTEAKSSGWSDVRQFQSSNDKFELSQKEENCIEPPKIGFFRVLFNRLTKEQIAEINENKILPKNAKIQDDLQGKPSLTWNLLDWSAGTHKLPAGYQLKNDILGFTHVVREGTQAWWFKKN